MTLEDFIESVIAGWVPLAWHPAAHLLAEVWQRVTVRAVPVLLLILARMRR